MNDEQAHLTSFYLYMVYGAFLGKLELPEVLPHRKGFEIRDTINRLAFTKRQTLTDYLRYNSLKYQVKAEMENAKKAGLSNLSAEMTHIYWEDHSNDAVRFLKRLQRIYPWEEFNPTIARSIIAEPEGWEKHMASNVVAVVTKTFLRLYFGERPASFWLTPNQIHIASREDRKFKWQIKPTPQFRPYVHTFVEGRDLNHLQVMGAPQTLGQMLAHVFHNTSPFELRNPKTGQCYSPNNPHNPYNPSGQLNLPILHP